MLTDTQCRNAKPKQKLYRLNDFNGLYLEVKPNGKSSMYALGEYALTLVLMLRKQ